MRVSLLEPYFPSSVRARALDYARAVRLLEQEDNALHLHIRGADDYCLRLERVARTLGVSCTCPYFESTGPCKHLWAALKYAERIGAFAGAPEPDQIVRLTGWRHSRARTGAVKTAPTPVVPQGPSWRSLIVAPEAATPRRNPLKPDAELVYVVDVDATRKYGTAQLEIASRSRKQDTDWSLPRPLSIDFDAIDTLPDPVDRQLVALVSAVTRGGAYGGYAAAMGSRMDLREGVGATVLQQVAATGRLLLRAKGTDGPPVAVRWDDGPPYEFRLVVTPGADPALLSLRGQLCRGDERVDLAEPQLLLREGLVFFADRIARFTVSEFRFIVFLREAGGEMLVPLEEGPELALELASQTRAPTVELPPSLTLEALRPAPRGVLRLRDPIHERDNALRGTLFFAYDDVEISEHERRDRLPVVHAKKLLHRDTEKEAALYQQLVAAGAKRELSYGADPGWTVNPRRLGDLAVQLSAAAWTIELNDKGFRTAGPIEVSVSSGIDWFDLNAEISYGNERIALPVLLAAARRGARYVKLSDGSMGLLPEAWLERHRLVGELGSAEGNAMRFGKNQLGLLDALLASLPEARVDKQLARAREALARFTEVIPRPAPKGFVGTLRAYQEEGLGWLEFLRDFGFGGCLADDMGLGKTIQVLALLESRRKKKGGKPSLVVVPKSLVFNWRREAQTFTPTLRVLEHHGPKRSLDGIGDYDLVVTTYGTLVRDALPLTKLEFDYVILDEAHAIKNPRTEAAKASRLLRGAHRLALTGTPIENRLSDLWSLFEFLNPGMLGASSVWKRFADESTPTDDADRAMLGKALRPFLLRRTKEQVAKDLPQKTEQIIYCELEGDERKQYDELRAHYRASLLGIVDEQGIGKSQMHILEALLRLRQAACHPALIDPGQKEAPSAKITALLGQLEDIVAGGHKAVVFSQFTSLLAVVRQRLVDSGIGYDYLDGKTRDRKAKVDRFQSDPTCSVFLVSLKAGGVGLNLTAAEYVFLLDPWWNPAVEAQAIDRAHRIGQTHPVIAYRLIGRDTIEEKVMELQSQKRALADAVVNADHALLGQIGRKELELLLS